MMILLLSGVGLMTWSPISFGLSMGDKEENTLVFEKLSIKVRTYIFNNMNFFRQIDFEKKKFMRFINNYSTYIFRITKLRS